MMRKRIFALPAAFSLSDFWNWSGPVKWVKKIGFSVSNSSEWGTVFSLLIWLLWGCTHIWRIGGQSLTSWTLGQKEKFKSFPVIPFHCDFRVKNYKHIWEILLYFSDSILRDKSLQCHQRAAPGDGHFPCRHKPALGSSRSVLEIL